MLTVVDAATLQENNFTALEFNEAMVMNVILHTQGGRLTQLKMLLDDRCSVHSLHKLIFSDIKNVQYRQNILDHIDKQGGIRRYRWQQVTKKAVEKASQKNGIQRSKSFHKIQYRIIKSGSDLSSMPTELHRKCQRSDWLRQLLDRPF